MKVYNTPQNELRIESDDGEVLVVITPDKAVIKNLVTNTPDVEEDIPSGE